MLSVLDTVLDVPGPRRESFSARFWDLLDHSTHTSIVVGYIGTESVKALADYVERNRDFHLNLMVGMQYHDGFTRQQVEALDSLDNALKLHQQGHLLVATKYRHHGKVYIFRDDKSDEVARAYVGSANLQNVTDGNPTLEAGVLVSDSENKLKSYLEKRVFPWGEKYGNLNIQPTREPESPLKHHESVEQITQDDLTRLLRSKPSCQFKIPVKTTEKSNLNCYFGKPRLSRKTGREKTRDWYEAEIIPGKEITSQPGYPPKGSVFSVVTDDGFKFDCQVQGDDGKNLRSADDLSILGAALKSRLEAAGVLKVGDKVTDECLKRYGRNDFDFIYYPDKKIWFIDFSTTRG